MRMRHIVLAGGLVSAAFIAVFGDRSGQREVVFETRTARAPTSAHLRASVETTTLGVSGHVGAESAGVLVLQDRGVLPAQQIKKQDPAPFAVLSWSPPPSTPASAGKPSAPPLPFKYLGKELEGDQWHVFLARENEVLIVKTNDVIGDAYRVESIQSSAVTFLYLPLNEAQQLGIQ